MSEPSAEQNRIVFLKWNDKIDDYDSGYYQIEETDQNELLIHIKVGASNFSGYVRKNFFIQQLINMKIIGGEKTE